MSTQVWQSTRISALVRSLRGCIHARHAWNLLRPTRPRFAPSSGDQTISREEVIHIWCFRSQVPGKDMNCVVANGNFAGCARLA